MIGRPFRFGRWTPGAQVGEQSASESGNPPAQNPMPKSDLVPCFYKEQDDSWEKPAKTISRGEARQLKNLGLGCFVNHGQAFRLFESQTEAIRQGYIDGAIGIGNLLPFSRIPNGTEKHRYPIPAACDHRIAWMNRFMAMPALMPAQDGVAS